MGNTASVKSQDSDIPPKIDLEPVAAEDTVDSKGRPCTIVFYKEKGYKGRMLAVKVRKGDTKIRPSVNDWGATDVNSARFEGKCTAEDVGSFKIRGYTGDKYTGKHMDFDLNGDYNQIPEEFRALESLQIIREIEKAQKEEKAVKKAEKKVAKKAAKKAADEAPGTPAPLGASPL